MATLCALSLAVAHAPAAAQSASDKETARALMKDGESRRAKGDLKGALQSFRAAHAIMNLPTTGLELGRTQAELGLLVEARDTLLAVTRMPVLSGESSSMPAARDEAQKLADEIEPKIPSLTVKLEGVAPGATPRVTIDGVAINEATIGVPRKHNPGAHEVVAVAGAVEKRASVELAEGDDKTVTLDLGSEPASADPDASGDPAPAETKRTSPLVYAGFGAAAAFAVVGSITGLVAFSRASRAREGCDGSQCPPATHDDIESSKTYGTVSTVTFVLAGAGAVVGVIGLWSAAPDKPPASAGHVRLLIGATGFTLAGAF